MAAAAPLPPRHLVLRAVAAASTIRSEDDPVVPNSDIPPALPGYMSLLAFYQPGLVAGKDYTIDVQQEWKFASGIGNTEYEKLEVAKGSKIASQDFSVVAPQFAVPAEDFHSTYPPQGQADQPSIAPHVVFNDPDLPWERDVTDSTDKTPWMAVFPFDINHPVDPELRHEPTKLREIFTLVAEDVNSLPADDEALRQFVSGTCTVKTTLYQYLDKIQSAKQPSSGAIIRRPPHYGVDVDGDDNPKPLDRPVELVFLKGSLFKKLFCIGSDTKPDIDQFQYCAHVRNINTEGVTGAGVSDKGLFSVIHSKRSGPTDIADSTPPRSQAVHLLSLEGLEGMDDVADGDIVAMISLYRWTYLCQPPLSVNFVDAMRDIGIQMKYSQLSEEEKARLDQTLTDPDITSGPDTPDADDSEGGLAENELEDVDASMMETPPGCYLRCSRSVIKALQFKAKTPQGEPLPDPLEGIRKSMVSRLENGYSIVRYRVQTGEETVGLFRGALLPVYPRDPPEFWPLESSNGQDYQIFDKDLGLMDISYSSAWNLGRMLATSDSLFVSALMRVRTRAYQEGLRANNLIAAHRDLGLTTKAHFFSALPDTLEALVYTSSQANKMPQISLEKRWKRDSATIDKVLNHDAFTAGIEKAIGNEGSADGNGNMPILDVFKSTSEDWRIIHDWILDRMYLAKIPTHYLIPDPTYLPPESIRFFHVDNNWMDCFIDGALSVANHTPLNQEDTIRSTIKEQFNYYLTTDIPKDPLDPEGEKLGKPQVPIFGFFLRSAVVSTFKDLIIEVPFPDEVAAAGRAPILVQRRMGPDLIMVLLDRIPDTAGGGAMSEIKHIKISQPPHQQRFAVADFLDEAGATLLFRKLSYDKDGGMPAQPTIFLDPAGGEINLKPGSQQIADPKDRIYDWDTRCLNLTNMGRLFFPAADDKYATLKFEGQEGNEPNPNVEILRGSFDTTDHGKFPEGFEDQWYNSAFAGLQLNDTAKFLQILPPTNGTKSPRRPYRIRTKADVDKPPSLNAARVALRLVSELRHDGSSTVEKLKPLALKAEKEAVPVTPVQAVVPSTSVIRAFGSKVKGKLEAILHDSDHDEDPEPESSLRGRVRGLGRSLSRRRGLVAPRPTLESRTPTDNTPNYKFRIFPREVRLPTDKDLEYKRGRQTIPTEGYIHTNVDHAVDLVISLQRSIRMNDKPLQEVKIVLPLGKKAARDKLREDKIKEGLNPSDVITGAGFAPVGGGGVRARMLSNQRWVVVLDESDLHLTIRVIPRPVREWDMVGVPGNRELSFMLTGVETNWQSVPVGDRELSEDLIKVSITETYGKERKGEDGTHQQSSIEIIKRA